MKTSIKTLTRRIVLGMLSILCIPHVQGQSNKSAAILGMYINEIEITPEMAADLFRIEISKTNIYQVLDKLDLKEVEQKADVEFISCYGKNCLDKAGKLTKVDYAITGSIESLGKKMVIAVKVYNVKTGAYEKTHAMEFNKNVAEIQRMVRIVIQSAYGLPTKQEEVEMLVYYEEPPESPRSTIRNDGPRFGLAYVGGETGDVLQKAEADGGYDALPLVSQFGYQFEKAYLSAGSFEALFEGLVQLTGVEQNMFIPSITFLNGFRSSKNGLEFGFGPSLNVKKLASGFEDSNGDFIIGDPGLSGYKLEKRVDSRGDAKLNASWVWAVGKTFRSGYLNMPVNAFFSHGKYGWYTGLSMGFNIQR